MASVAEKAPSQNLPGAGFPTGRGDLQEGDVPSLENPLIPWLLTVCRDRRWGCLSVRSCERRRH